MHLLYFRFKKDYCLKVIWGKKEEFMMGNLLNELV